MVQRALSDIEQLKAEVRRLRGELQRISIGGVMLPSSQSGSASVPTALLGAMIRGNSTPGWERFVLSAPAAALRTIVGIDNGDTVPGAKALFDSTNPVSIDFGDSVGPGTSLTAAHRDHSHGEGDVVFMINMAAAL